MKLFRSFLVKLPCMELSYPFYFLLAKTIFGDKSAVSAVAGRWKLSTVDRSPNPLIPCQRGCQARQYGMQGSADPPLAQVHMQ